jgi:hypothetical protein
LLRPEKEPKCREDDAQHVERPRDRTFEAGDARDRRGPGDEGGRKRCEDLPFGLAELATEDRTDRDERGDRDNGRRAQQEDATERQG